MTIRVLLADDQELLRHTFRILIDSAPDMNVVGEASDGAQALEMIRQHRPDVVLMDIRMPGVDGLAATEAICADPEMETARVLILTTFEIEEYVAHALRAGASGFLGKDVSADALLGGIRTVARGDALLSPQAVQGLVSQFLLGPAETASSSGASQLDELTEREREVMALAAHGLSNNEIADELFISPFTARTHIHRAMTKLHARDRAQLVVIAYQTGLVRPGPR